MLLSCVRLSLTSRSSTKMVKRRITQTMPYDNPGTLGFDAKKIVKIPTVSPPLRGVPNTGGEG